LQVARDDDRFIFLQTGQQVAPPLMEMLQKRIRALIKARRPRHAILGTLVKIVRASAVRNTTIGQDLLSLCIPRPPIGRQDFLITTGGPDGDSPTFQNWPAHSWDGVLCGPTIVAGGNVLTNFKTRSIVADLDAEKLGGLEIANGLPQRLHYPCCALFNDLTNCYMSVSNGASPPYFLAIFTSEEAIKENLRRSPDRLIRHWLRSADDVIKMLLGIRDLEMIMLNPNTHVRGITFSTSKQHLLQLLRNG